MNEGVVPAVLWTEYLPPSNNSRRLEVNIDEEPEAQEVSDLAKNFVEPLPKNQSAWLKNKG